ncbi:TonB-dependent receptor [Fontibacter flavus]|uniref:TonB-dependent receptor domain-containing protein n=1 Tax=Fontibacter flavus TaxID=654838 RepID=A0ABV6FRG9_9BACT
MNIKQSKNLLLILFAFTMIFIVPGNAHAQKGTIRGSIFDATNGEPLFGVSVLVVETQTGAVTDFDGDFTIQVDPGTYSLKISFISYNSIEIGNVEVTAGKVTLLENIKMEEFTSDLETVVVSAEAIRTTEAALMSVKRNAPNLLDGISSSTFRQIGDGDAASAIKRVTGVSVEGGKYVYIRGLGDRYTKTILNGVEVPGLDPDRNTIQMDIFPTNVIDNIIVSKSFSAELPADFTGGVVDIETKDFPEEKTMVVNVSGGYNPSMHFNQNSLAIEGGKTDWLGFDDGTRTIPTKGVQEIPQFGEVIGNPNSEKGQIFQNVLRNFNPVLGGTRQTSPMDFGLGYSLGNQFQIRNKKIGYNLALTYRNETEFFKDAEFNLFGKPRNATDFNLEALEQSKGDYTVNNVLLGGVFGLAYKSDFSKIKLNFLRLQSGESKVGQFYFINTNLGAEFEADQYNIEYSQRAMSNVLLSGSHFLKGNKWQVNWKLSPTLSTIEDPDVRITRFRVPTNTIGTEVGLPTRIWRSLEEQNLFGNMDISDNYTLFGQSAKLKFGGAYVYKNRDFLIQDFQFPAGSTTFNGDPNQVLLEENLFSADNRNGIRYDPTFIPINPNQYNSNLTNYAGYVSNEFNPLKNLKAILGLRIEKYTQFYTGTNQTNTIVFDNDKVLDDLDFFPTLNLVQAMGSNQNLRFAASRTIARPSFKELSFAEILDPITGRSFIGSLFPETTEGGTEVLWDGNLQSTRINNFDLRWEKFMKRSEIFSLSLFYKSFDKPIEMVQFLSDPGAFQPRNVGNGSVLGVELELRKSLDIIAPSLENFFFNANLTLVESKIQMSESEFRSRQLSAREGETVSRTRQMAGQAPYIINTGLSYNNVISGIEAGLFYNVQGGTLNYVGFGNRTDTYTVSFHSLNFNINKTWGKSERLQTSLNVTNILDDYREEAFRMYNAEDEIFTRLRPGRRASLRIRYSIW